jgi:hypothetical protein
MISSQKKYSKVLDLHCGRQFYNLMALDTCAFPLKIILWTMVEDSFVDGERFPPQMVFNSKDIEHNLP